MSDFDESDSRDAQLDHVREQVVTLGKRLGEAMADLDQCRRDSAEARAKADKADAKADKALRKVSLITRVLEGLTTDLKETP